MQTIVIYVFFKGHIGISAAISCCGKSMMTLKASPVNGVFMKCFISMLFFATVFVWRLFKHRGGGGCCRMCVWKFLFWFWTIQQPTKAPWHQITRPPLASAITFRGRFNAGFLTCPTKILPRKTHSKSKWIIGFGAVEPLNQTHDVMCNHCIICITTYSWAH